MLSATAAASAVTGSSVQSGRNITAEFTDANFLAAVRTALGKGATGNICDTDDFASVASLNVSDKEIASLVGIGRFTALTSLDCSINELTALPALPSSLLELYCTNNRLTSLPALPSGMTRINCSDNQLTGLPDLPSGMTRLDCSGNLLASLPALPPVLTSLDCSRNRLTGVALNSGVRWDKLDVRYNYMPALTKVTGFSGTREGGRYDYTPQHAPDFRMVTNVIDLPADMVAVNVPLTLSGTVVPADATRRNIVWSIIYSGKTGATLSGNTITAKAAGTVAVRVKITGGYASGKDFVKDFEINFK